VWEYDPMECPQTIVKLYKGMMKAYVNQTSTYEGSTVVVEHQDKDQAAGLEVAESFILCGHQAFRSHIKSIAVFVHKDDQMEVAQGRFFGKEGEVDLTRLESGMSFMQVRASMSMKEKLRQVRGATCENRRDIARTRLEAVVQPHLHLREGPPRHQGRRGRIRDKVLSPPPPVEVVPRIHSNCTEEILVTVNGTDAFVDPISYVIKSTRSPIHCDDVVPPRYKVGGKWYCSYPELKECHDPAMLPVGEVKIDPVEVNNIGLGKSIYPKEQLDKFARFQDSQGTRKAYLAETAERACTGRTENGEWGLALSPAAQGSIIDIVGASFFPLYSVVGPMIFFISLMLLVWGVFRLMVTVLIRAIIIIRCKGCGIWVMTALWGTLFQLAITPFTWMNEAMEGVGECVGQMMETEADREPEEEKPRRRALSMEDLRRKYPWWPSSSGKEPIALIDMEATGGEGTALRSIKSTKL
jgi:hypothetical protein